MSSPSAPDFSDAARVLTEAAADGAFPAAVAEVGSSRAPVWTASVGTLWNAEAAPPATRDTIFDLASLTKPLATTTLAMKAVAAGRLSLDARLETLLPQWRGQDRDHVTVADLLAHTSGLTAHLPLYRDDTGRVDFERAICTLPLEYGPRTRAVYSDLGFMLLGFILEDALRRPLDASFAEVCDALGTEDIRFRPPVDWRPRTAPTGLDAWRGRVLAADVHDRNAWALGGVAGHAGLFGTAAATGAFARAWLVSIAGTGGSPFEVPVDLARRFTRRTQVPGSSRALGWDTMLPTSSCGTRMNPDAVGHTGFTGTSLWLDPRRDLYVVLLTNRVHPTDENQRILQVRPAFHDAVVRAFE
jgi:CubicO group peptidase (beta-lactamase class C family)